MAFLPRITRNAVSSGRGVVSDEASRYQASAYAQLAQTARIVGQTVRKREIEAGMQEGETAFRLAEAEAGDGPVAVPTRDGGLLDFLGVKDEAYFQAVQTLQATRAERDAARALTDIRGDSVASPTAFMERAKAWKEGYVSEMGDPAVARAVLSDIDALIEKNFLEVKQERQSADLKEARSGMDAKLASVESNLDAILREQGPDAAASPEFQRLNADREALLSMKADNPLYAYSDDERMLDDQKFERRVQTAVLTPQIMDIFEIEGRAGALEASEAIVESLGLDTAEAVAMRSSLRNEINLMAEVDAAREAERTAAETRRKDFLSDVSDREQRALIDTLRNPDLSQTDKLDALQNIRDLLTPSQYAGYMKDITGGADGLPVSQFATLRNMARRGEISRDDLPDLGLSQTQLNSLVSDVDKYSSSVAKAGKIILDGGFAQEEFSFDPAVAAIESEAVAEYDQWLTDNEESTPEQARNRAREIAADRGRALAVTKFSRYLDLDEKKPEESYARAEDAILEDLEAERITADEAAAEMRKLTRIRTLIGQ